MGGDKRDEGKTRLDLIPPEVIEALGRVLTHGADKYSIKIELSPKEVLALCDSQRVIQIERYRPEDCADVAMRNSLKPVIQNTLSDNYKATGDGTGPIWIGQGPLSGKRVKTQSIIEPDKYASERNFLGSQTSNIKTFVNRAAVFVVQPNTYTVTMTTRQEYSEAYYVISATSALDCWVTLLKVLQEHSLISNRAKIKDNKLFICGDNNWRGGIQYTRVYGAILRHLNAWRAGEINDKESGLPHLWHALCELAFLLTYEIEGRAKELDDIHGNGTGKKEISSDIR